ncbi:KH domain-containing protein At4g18375-like [Aristolochia californica]|uniref:KH domain-containing protein At4g18375-like n=1 Tax=Aristolochia californica TaxID=171875 RepID=UPI0035DE43D0
MFETGKRSRSHRDNDVDEKHQKKKSNQIQKDTHSEGELVVYRILCPDNVIGSVIGKSGKVINSIRQETRSKIKVVDPFPGSKERVLTIYCYVKSKDDNELDENDKPLCPAQDAFLKVHAAIVNAVAATQESDKKRKEDAQILVPSSQVANVIGKSGSTIKKIRSKTRALIKVTPKDPNDPTHSCAMSFDNFVQISGEAGAVKKALISISAIMYKFSPKEEISLETSVPDLPPSIIIPSDIPIYPAGGFYSGADALVPPRSAPPVMGATPQFPEIHGYPDTSGAWPIYSSALPVVSAYGGPTLSEEMIVRVLCPSDKIGRVIGRGGSSIKSVRQASGARIEVDDPKEDWDECVITVTSMESPDDIKSNAVEAVLLLQGKINDNDDDDTVTMRILVPSKIIGCLIGKSGAIINEMRKRTKADVRISKSEKPKCAFNDDELVEVVGEVGSVRDALVQIVLRLRDDALKDKKGGRSAPPPLPSVEPPLYTGGGGLAVPSTVLPSGPPLGYDHRIDHPASGFGMLSTSNLYGYGSLPVENGYGSIPSYSSKGYGGFHSSILEIVIPANAVGKVMGKGGANIANIRKISGAVVEILDSKSSRSDRIAQVSGTPEQKRAAENLIQAFILAT